MGKYSYLLSKSLMGNKHIFDKCRNMGGRRHVYYQFCTISLLLLVNADPQSWHKVAKKTHSHRLVYVCVCMCMCVRVCLCTYIHTCIPKYIHTDTHILLYVIKTAEYLAGKQTHVKLKTSMTMSIFNSTESNTDGRFRRASDHIQIIKPK